MLVTSHRSQRRASRTFHYGHLVALNHLRTGKVHLTFPWRCTKRTDGERERESERYRYIPHRISSLRRGTSGSPWTCEARTPACIAPYRHIAMPQVMQTAWRSLTETGMQWCLASDRPPQNFHPVITHGNGKPPNYRGCSWMFHDFPTK